MCRLSVYVFEVSMGVIVYWCIGSLVIGVFVSVFIDVGRYVGLSCGYAFTCVLVYWLL